MRPHREARKRARRLVAIGVAILLVTVVVSYRSINGAIRRKDTSPRGTLTLLREIVPKMVSYSGAGGFADLREQDVPTEPANWLLRDDKRLTRVVSGTQLKGRDLQHASATRGFLVNAQRGREWGHEADFRGANLFRANFQGAHLRGAKFHGANLTFAHMGGANLQDANLQGANLRRVTGLTPSQVKAAKNWK